MKTKKFTQSIWIAFTTINKWQIKILITQAKIQYSYNPLRVTFFLILHKEIINSIWLLSTKIIDFSAMIIKTKTMNMLLIKLLNHLNKSLSINMEILLKTSKIHLIDTNRISKKRIKNWIKMNMK